MDIKRNYSDLTWTGTGIAVISAAMLLAVLNGARPAVAATQVSGTATVTCQITGNTGVTSPGCRVCVTTAGATVCDRDSSFQRTGQTPKAPSDAVVTSFYLSGQPFPINLSGYSIQLSHAGKTEVIAVADGGPPVYPTAKLPLTDFNGTVVENGSWSFSLNTLPAVVDAGWALGFEYNFTWHSAGGASLGTVAPAQGAPLACTPAVLRFGNETSVYCRRNDHLIQFDRASDSARWSTLDLTVSTSDSHAITPNPIAISTASGDSTDVFALTWDGQLLNFRKRGTLPWAVEVMPAVPAQSLQWTPFAMYDHSGELHVFAIDLRFRLLEWVRSGNAWHVQIVVPNIVFPGLPPVPIAFQAYGSPVAFEDAATMHVVLKGVAGPIRYLSKLPNGSWGYGELPTGPPGQSAYSLAVISNNVRADVAVRGGDLYLYTKPYNDTKSYDPFPAANWVAKDSGIANAGLPALTTDGFTTYMAVVTGGNLAFAYGVPGSLTVSRNFNQTLSVFDPGITRDPHTGMIYVFVIDQQGALLELRRTSSDQWSSPPPAFP